MAAQLSMWEQPVEDAAPEEASAPPLEELISGPFPLIPHQELAVDAIQKGLKDYRSFLDVMPTGTGKTRVAT